MMFSVRHSLLKLSFPLVKLLMNFKKIRYITHFLQLIPCLSVFQYCYANLELCLKDMLIKPKLILVIKILLLTPFGAFRYSWLYFNMFLQTVERRYGSGF